MAHLDCPTCQERMVEAFGGELSPREQKDFEAHLAQCASCGEIWKDYQELHSAVAHWAHFQQPKRATVDQILEAADSRKKSPRRIALHPWWKVLLSPPALAAAMLLLVAGVGLYSQRWMEIPKSRPVSVSPTVVPAGEGAVAKPEAPPLKRPEKELGRAKQDKNLFQPVPASPTLLRSNAGGAASEAPSLAQDQMKAEPKPTAPPPAEPAAPGAGLASVPAKAPAPPPPAQDSLEDRESEASAVRATTMQEEKAKKSESATPAPETELVKSAKTKMKAKNYTGALEDLQKARQLNDSEEIRKLIKQCQEKLKSSPR